MDVAKIGDGACLKMLIEVLKPILCPPAERAAKQFLRSHRIEFDLDKDVVLSVSKKPEKSGE